MSTMNLPVYTLADVTAAADAKRPTLHAWFHRGLVALDTTDKPAAVAGATTMLTGSTALALAIALALAKQGVPVESAIRAGLIFAKTGTEDRQPAHLFKGTDVDETLIVFSRGEGRTEDQCSIVPHKPGMAVEDLIKSASYGINSCARIEVFPIFNLVNQIRSRLGLPEDR